MSDPVVVPAFQEIQVPVRINLTAAQTTALGAALAAANVIDLSRAKKTIADIASLQWAVSPSGTSVLVLNLKATPT
jgi:hypothetical protein